MSPPLMPSHQGRRSAIWSAPTGWRPRPERPKRTGRRIAGRNHRSHHQCPAHNRAASPVHLHHFGRNRRSGRRDPARLAHDADGQSQMGGPVLLTYCLDSTANPSTSLLQRAMTDAGNPIRSSRCLCPIFGHCSNKVTAWRSPPPSRRPLQIFLPPVPPRQIIPPLLCWRRPLWPGLRIS